MEAKKQFFPLINSLRAFAVLIVIFFHGITEVFCREHGYYYPFKNGFLGVDLFFVLSGFLITNVLIREYLLTGKVSIKNFYIRRILRLYPPIIVAIVIFLVPLSFFNFKDAFSNFFFLATYTGDIVMLFRHFIPYLEYPLFFSHCWSLSIEEQFYIFYPTLFLIFLKVFGRKKINFSFLFYIFNVFFLLLVVVGTLLMGGHFYKFFLWRFFEIFMGVFLALLTNESFKKQFNIDANKSINGIVRFLSSSITLYIALAITVLTVLGLLLSNYGLHYYVFSFTSGIVILHAAFEDNKILNTVLSGSVLQYLGKISYGLYLYHYPVFYSTQYLKIKLEPQNIYQAMFIDVVRIGIALIISILSYELIEKRILKLRTKFEA
ncbi:hypothetical protein A3860_00810 [Niastella vici]|uniref:Acyltransferase 3 domain-containing protein n=1 Tax=Niastella vici TaxID=1703345 RepID=A0A1V9G8I9_9BACT|nr:acyltransferase [Niastella vici]OQP66933.1 hypothetical protein A3860_00810 [Niastella vici]